MLPAGKFYVVYGKQGSVFTLWDIADIHEGNAGVVHDRLHQHIDSIARDPYQLWFGGGDWAECISIDDKRYDGLTLDLTRKELTKVGKAQRNRLVTQFDRIKGQGIGIGCGNHEYKYFLTKEQNVAQGVAKKLKLPYLGYSFIFDLVFLHIDRLAKKGPFLTRDRPKQACATTEVRIFAHHGGSGAATNAGQVSALERLARDYEADVIFTAHCHSLHPVPLVTIGADKKCENLIEKCKWAIMTGTFLKTFNQGTAAGYGERKPYRPSFLGAAGIKIRPYYREMSPGLPWMGF